MSTATTRTVISIFLLLLISKVLLAQPSNDNNCSGPGPTSLTPGTTCTTTAGTLYQATVGSPTSSCGTTYDVWYSFTVPANSTSVDIDVSVGGGSNLNSSNTFVEAFSGAVCSPIILGTCTAMGTTLTLTGLTPSATYYVRNCLKIEF